MFTLLAPSAIKGATPVEVPLPEGSASARVGVEPSRSLFRANSDPHVWEGSPIQWADLQNPKATLLTLDDVAEEREWGSIHVEVGTTVSTLSVMLDSL